MSYPNKRLAAIFFLPLEVATQGLPKLATEAGAAVVSSPANSDSVLDCQWAGMNCKASLIRSAFFCILEISFWQSDFLRLIDGQHRDLEMRSTSILAESFRQACEALSPRFAFIATHLDQSTHEWILGLEWSVLNHEANRLATQGLGMVYFDDEMNDYWTPSPAQEDRDMIAVSKGRLMFAGRGESRWFG